MSYRIEGLPSEPFAGLAEKTDDELEALGARRMIADAPNSAPCRVSLIDAEPGERLILLTHRHLDAPLSPYRSEGPIFVREGAARPSLPVGYAPDQLTRRLLSVRAYDSDWMMIDADVVNGADLDARLRGWLGRDDVGTVHIHTARRGCYLAAAVRA